MNKLNLLLLISLVVLAGSCRKIELPEPKEEEPLFGFWSGLIGETPILINNDSLFMSTKIDTDPLLHVNTYETTFNKIGSNKPTWIMKYRDSKSMRATADTSDLFYVSQSRYLKSNQLNQTGDVVTHSLRDIELGNEVAWFSNPGVSGTVNGGRHLSVENTDLNQVNVVKVSIQDNGKVNYIEKTYRPKKGDINLEAVRIVGNNITFEVDQPSRTPNLRFKWGQGTPNTNNTFAVNSSGLFRVEISDVIKQCYLILEINLDLSNGVIKQPKLPLFTSNHSIKYASLPNFSKMEIVYFDDQGNEYSTRYADQPKPFVVNKIETFNKNNQLGQKVKKLNIEFSVTLKTANGNDSIVMTGVKGDIGFAYE